MSKIIKVETCEQCPYSAFDGWNEILYCVKLKLPVYDIEFEKDCPIEEE